MTNKISVSTHTIPGLMGAEINIRYCNDRPNCKKRAEEAGKKGEFPK